MTQDRYLEMCDQLGKKPVESEIPPDWADLPHEVQVAISIFNTMGDRLMSDIGYLGKDYVNLPILIEIYEVEDREFLLEILTFLDSRAIKQSSEQMKKEMDKLKRKSNRG